MPKTIRITVDHDKKEVLINILTEVREDAYTLECKDTINTRMILNEVFNSINFNEDDEALEFAEVIEGEYTTIDRW